MDRKKIKAVIEAILFAMGNSVEVAKISKVLEVPKSEVVDILKEMSKEYENGSHGISLVFFGESVQFCTKTSLYDYLIKIVAQPKKSILTDSLLETLSIIAYRQPVTKLDIEHIRGVKSDHAVNRLIEYGLVEEAGRCAAPGRPLLFRTTEEFLRSFGISKLSELPVPEPEKEKKSEEEALADIPVVV